MSLQLRVFLCLFIVYSASVSGQDSIENAINTSIEQRHASFDSLQKYTSAFKRDSLAIASFIKKSKNAGYTYGNAFGENLLGIYLRDHSYYEEALEHHDKALKLANELNDVELKVSVLNMTGVVYRRIDAVSSALDKHNAALALAESQSKKSRALLKGIAISQNSIGNIYLLLRDYDDAEKFFKMAINSEANLTSDLGLAINYGNLGITYEERKQYDKALENYKKSLEYNNKINNDLGRVICNNSIGQVYLKQGKSSKALSLINEVLPKAEKIGDKFYIALTYINLGWAYSELGNHQLGEEYLMKGKDIADENDHKQFLSMAYMHLSQLKEQQGNYQEALAYQRSSQEVQEEYLNQANQKYVTNLIYKYDSEQKKNTIELLKRNNQIAQIELSQSKKNNIFILLLSLLLLIILFILYRQMRLKNAKQRLNAEQKLMRSQMNPHFIFNALLSIRIYLQNSNVEDAMRYLNQFAKLIRSILTSSLEKEITLQEELDTMQLYVNIENIRFCNEIQYAVHIDERVDLKAIKIPSLILQPFIENALWHGLQPKEGEKLLTLDVALKNDEFVTITITDNGIGRKKTMEVASEKVNTQKKSIGINLTLRRLQNFSKNLRNTYALRFIDLYDEQEYPAGTQVLIDLPIK